MEKVIKLPDGLVLSYTENQLFFDGFLGKDLLSVNKKVKIQIELNFLKIITKKKNFLILYDKLIKNFIFGVMYGFHLKMKLKGVGFYFSINNFNLYLSVGFSHKVKIKVPKNLQVLVKKKRKLFIYGDSLEDVNRFGALVRNFKFPDIYKGKGVLYKGEKVTLKIGKKT